MVADNNFIRFIDTTLRDGEQAPGVVFSLNDKMKIAEKLDAMGVDELEIGTPSMGPREVSDIRTLINAGFTFQSSCWCRATKHDLDQANFTGCNAVNISFPVSDIQLEAINRDRNWVLNELPEILKYAHDHFEFVSIGAQDASRADREFLRTFTEAAHSCGARRIRIADTIGILNPLSTYDLINEVCSYSEEMFVEFHGHNDLGMATANTLMAIEAGAEYISGTVGGLGERAGNAPIEEVALALNMTTDLKSHLDLTAIKPLAEFVADAANRPIPLDKPLTGEMVLKHESGVHTRSLLKNRKTYQPFDGELIGRTDSQFVYGKHSGRASIDHFLQIKGLPVNEKSISRMLSGIKITAEEKKRALSEDELMSIFSASYS